MEQGQGPGALPGTSREAFPGVSLLPTDFRAHLTPTHCTPTVRVQVSTPPLELSIVCLMLARGLCKRPVPV